MAVCSHDMMFTFVYTGLEEQLMILAYLLMPYIEVKTYFLFLLVGFLAPYRGERYHRSDFHRGGGMRGKEELFNYTHSSVRNVIERAFGVLKARFHIIKVIPNYPLRRHMLMLHGCCAFTEYGQDYLEVPSERSNAVQEGFPIDPTDNTEMLQLRESIADSLSNNYNGHRRRRQF